MDELIKKLIAEGKSDAEIAAAVLAAHADQDAEEITAKIIQAKKLEDVMKGIKKDADAKKEAEAKKAKDAEDSKKIEAEVIKAMRSIKVLPKFGAVRELKSFDPITKKVVAVNDNVSEQYGAMNAMMLCALNKDFTNAEAISREIEQENNSYRKEIQEAARKTLESKGIKTANDPSVTDSNARGGYAIPTEVDLMITQLLYQESVMLNNMNTNNIIYNSKIYPLVYGMSVSDIADESTAVTETQPTFSNPTISMKRAGCYTNISNELIKQKGADLVRGFMDGFASEFAKFLDYRLAVGNVTGASQLVDGIAFDSNSNAPTAIELNALTMVQIGTIINTLSANAGGDIVLVANRKVRNKIGLMENTGGMPYFPQFINGGNIAPFGIPLILNKQITSVLDIGGDNNTGGTDDALLCYIKQYAIAGVDGETRIDMTNAFRFTNDVTTMMGIKRYGSKILSGSGTAGIVSVVQELTN